MDAARRAFKMRVDDATDWGHEHGFPISVIRDSNGLWLISAKITDAHGQFRAECYVTTSEGVRAALDNALAIARRDRKKAFAGRSPGHLPVAPKPICKYGDPLCPCPDGDPCHYEGKNPMRPPE